MLVLAKITLYPLVAGDDSASMPIVPAAFAVTGPAVVVPTKTPLAYHETVPFSQTVTTVIPTVNENEVEVRATVVTTPALQTYPSVSAVPVGNPQPTQSPLATNRKPAAAVLP